jgi:hypothetical protein
MLAPAHNHSSEKVGMRKIARAKLALPRLCKTADNTLNFKRSDTLKEGSERLQ